MKEIVLPDCQPPFIALAHSMGGHILLRNATLPGSWFSRMVLSAPMISIAEARLGAPLPVSRLYAEILGGLGLGSMYVRGGVDLPIEFGPFEGNPLTSDRERFTSAIALPQAAPALGLDATSPAARRVALDAG
jgi:lysophospholipase